MPSADQEALQRSSFALRKSLVTLRRVILPMREVVNTLLRRDLHLVADEMGPYFQDVYDHVLRAMKWTESLRDLATSILEANLALQGNRLNVITKKVTGYAAIIAVPTAVTGFYGQNVPYPGFSEIGGFFSSVALIVGFSTQLFFLFKRNDWISDPDPHSRAVLSRPILIDALMARRLWALLTHFLARLNGGSRPWH